MDSQYQIWGVVELGVMVTKGLKDHIVRVHYISEVPMEEGVVIVVIRDH